MTQIFLDESKKSGKIMKEKEENKSRLQYKHVQRILILVQLYFGDEISLVNGHVKEKREGQTSTTKLALIAAVCREMCTSVHTPTKKYIYVRKFCT